MLLNQTSDDGMLASAGRSERLEVVTFLADPDTESRGFERASLAIHLPKVREFLGRLGRHPRTIR